MLKFPDLDQTKGITWMQSDPFDMTTTTTRTPTTTITPANCLIEHEVNYVGHDITNGPLAVLAVAINGHADNIPDWQSCKFFCIDEYPTAQYFTYVQSNNKCWCKTSDAGRRTESGVISGEVTCSTLGEPQFM